MAKRKHKMITHCEDCQLAGVDTPAFVTRIFINGVRGYCEKCWGLHCNMMTESFERICMTMAKLSVTHERLKELEKQERGY